MIKSDSIANLTKALIKAQSGFSTVIRGNENPFFKRGNQPAKYADLATVIEATEQSLLDNGLTVSQFPHNDGDRIGVLTILLHESGEFIQHEFALPISKQDAQTGVGAVTYARRAALKAVLNVAEEDDDGNTASHQTEAPKSVSKPCAPKPVPKAEVPNERENGLKTGSSTSTNSVLDLSLPTKEEKDAYRVKFGKLVETFKEAGLEPNTGLPIQKKVLAFLLKETGKANADQITKQGWEDFFSKTSILEVKTLIDNVNYAVEEKK